MMLLFVKEKILKENRKICGFNIFSVILLAITFIGLIYFINARIDYLLNSDDSSELILGKLLASENKLLSKRWYYSTELRVLNTQIFYALFFHITSSWHKVRVLSYICMYSLLLLIYFFLCKSLECKKQFAITAVLLFIPFSEQYFSIMLKGAYYIPHIAITFILLAFSEVYIKGQKRKICLVSSVALSVVAGMGGARQIIVLYIPMLLANVLTFFDKYKTDGLKKWRTFAFITFCGASVGYVINTKILANMYHFLTWNNVSFSPFDISRFTTVLNGFLYSYGFVSRKVLSFALITNLVCAAWIVFTIYAIVYAFKNKTSISEGYFRLSAFTAAAFITYILLYMFTNLSYVDRYNLPVIVLSIPLLAVASGQVKVHSISAKLFVFIFVILAVLNGTFSYKEKIKQDSTAELRQISDVLVSQEYYDGYATFWHANILTELSNGNIDVWDWCDSGDGTRLKNIDNIDQTYKWLQLIEHDYLHPSRGKVFVLLTKTEYQNINWSLNEDHIVYQSEAYTVFGYENYDTLLAEISS